MKRVIGDEYEVQHVLGLIRDQWSIDPAVTREMETARYLERRLREELVEHGGVEPEQIETTSDIAFWFLVYECDPTSWQYAFAECLLCLMSDFSEPVGNASSAREKLYLENVLRDLEKHLRTLVIADEQRLTGKQLVNAKRVIGELRPLAETGRKNRAAGEKGRARGAKSSNPDRDRQIFEAVQQMVDSNPRLLKKVICSEVGAQFGIKTDAVQKAIYRYKSGNAK